MTVYTKPDEYYLSDIERHEINHKNGSTSVFHFKLYDSSKQELKHLIDVAICYNKTWMLEQVLEYFGAPDNLTLKEKLTWYQLLGD